MAAMSRAFLKMHGLGNDFVVIDARTQPYAPPAEEVRAISNRRTGVGCDQFIVIEPTKRPDAAAFMRIFNADGGEVGACGNASRCVGRLLMDEAGAAETAFETAAGLLRAYRAAEGLVTVDMGPALLDWRDVPLAGPADTLRLDDVAAREFSGPTAVGMGNPHAVFFVENAEAVALDEVGPVFEHHPMFPQKTNVEFVHLLGPDSLRMRVWERGVGVTQACGTGACAAAVAAMRRGLVGRTADVVLDGGTLRIHWRESDGHVLMNGSATIAYSGVLSEELSPS